VSNEPVKRQQTFTFSSAQLAPGNGWWSEVGGYGLETVAGGELHPVPG